IGGPLPSPPPLFPKSNWWNLDISKAPVDPGAAGYLSFIGNGTPLHPDFGGNDGPVNVFGFPYIVVDGTTSAVSVEFDEPGESDGVTHPGNVSFPFYPIPSDAIDGIHWIEGGEKGSVDQRDDNDRHILMVDAANRKLYELYNVFYDKGVSQWF